MNPSKNFFKLDFNLKWDSIIMVTSSFLRSVWYRTSPANSIYTVHLVNHTCTGRQISTLPQNVVPSMLTSLTSLFGMVRGVLLVAWLPSFMLLHEVNVLNGRALFYHSQRNELCLDFRQLLLYCGNWRHRTLQCFQSIQILIANTHHMYL